LKKILIFLIVSSQDINRSLVSVFIIFFSKFFSYCFSSESGGIATSFKLLSYYIW